MTEARERIAARLRSLADEIERTTDPEYVVRLFVEDPNGSWAGDLRVRVHLPASA